MLPLSQTAIAKRLPAKLFACDFPPEPPPEPTPQPQPDIDCQSYTAEVRPHADHPLSAQLLWGAPCLLCCRTLLRQGSSPCVAEVTTAAVSSGLAGPTPCHPAGHMQRQAGLRMVHQRGSAQCLLHRWVAVWAWLRGERLCIQARHDWSQRTGAACQLHGFTGRCLHSCGLRLAPRQPLEGAALQTAATLPFLHLPAEAEAKRLPAAVFRCKFPSLAAEQ